MELKKKDGMLVEEKTARMRVEQTLQSATERLLDVEDKLKRVEESTECPIWKEHYFEAVYRAEFSTHFVGTYRKLKPKDVQIDW